MSVHTASVTWTRATPDFNYDTYDRTHGLHLGSGLDVTASSAVEFKGNPELVNPEELLVGALASCHMLTFLAIAARKRLVVDSYACPAEGVLERNAEGKLSITRVTLRPHVRFAPGTGVDAATLEGMHHTAHANCFIAQSLKTEVSVQGTLEIAAG